MAICGDCISHQGAKKGVRQYACGKKIAITVHICSILPQYDQTDWNKKVTTKIDKILTQH